MNLDPQSQAMLDAITVKEVAALTQDDIGFLRARKSYLTSEQHNRYAEVLEVQQESAAEQPAVATEEAQTEEEAPKKGKKAKTDEAES